MNPFEMVLGIIIVITIGRVLQAKYGYRHRRRGGMEPIADDAETRRLRDEVRALKERIAVLERLATDDAGPRALEREIEALRSRDA
ncbi:hypothetical protein SCH01S_01_01590 [Sphingomonas changbaiensis NBRC 104936]|jgi:hypothetical protein|uniref:Phage shock protein B n=1 Tax=Sphingomonas changbaiensis NBRC 104936 TaxID=1219043 RepID=A0A0E9MKQ7_9SPHN|nr:hypothetical protein [Sphingomonas changbaiensis]GAO37996.1 hypothetical protein SCH01S_01_01590 [Sphingomonas changbaiensis NBRC 104936]